MMEHDPRFSAVFTSVQMNDLARKDLFVCLGIWLALETVCFGLLPLLQLGLPKASLQTWFLLSLLLGVGGAVLMASSTQLAEFLQLHNTARGRFSRSAVVSLVSWLGLIGIGFPLFVMSMQICGKVFDLLKA
jgi:hypothetical protein